MPRRRIRRRLERDVADQLGDDYKYTNNPALAAQRAENRRLRHIAASARMDPNPHPKCSITACDGWAMPNESLNICITHAVTAWEMVETSDQHPYLREQLATTIAERDRIRAEHRATIRAETTKEIRSLDAIGEVYFVRVNGLIKVGWSSNLYARLRAYGPTAELLVCYDGTKRTEADLHRQLTPARAKGREWYHDGDIVNMFLDQAIEQHGSPPFRFARWTTHDGATPGKTKRLGY